MERSSKRNFFSHGKGKGGLFPLPPEEREKQKGWKRVLPSDPRKKIKKKKEGRLVLPSCNWVKRGGEWSCLRGGGFSFDIAPRGKKGKRKSGILKTLLREKKGEKRFKETTKKEGGTSPR